MSCSLGMHKWILAGSSEKEYYYKCDNLNCHATKKVMKK